jgi:hypothetical protein
MAVGLAAVAVAQQRAPVLVELFTSEGCSSCPPADDVLARLDRYQPVSGVEVIALSEHVDYWNHLGWKDPYSSPLFSERQENYGKVFRLESVYTPQMVVNGQAQVLGSDWASANQAIRAAAQSPRAVVTLEAKDWDTLSFEITQLPKGTRGADIMLAVTEGNLETSVGGGENSGRRLHHTGVVRSLTSLGRLDSKNGVYSGDARLNLNPQWNRTNLNLVLFIQDRATHRILGAAVHP